MIFLSAGHSTVDPGAVTKQRIDDTHIVERKEADIVAEFRNLVSYYLLAWGVPHAVDSKGTDNVPLAGTVKLIGNNRPAVEFHCNAADAAIAGGVETLSNARDLVLGEQLCVAVAVALGIKNRGAKPENSGQHHRLAFVQAGGVILELFFLSNPKELAAYDARKWLAAKAVAQVLMQAKTS